MRAEERRRDPLRSSTRKRLVYTAAAIVAAVVVVGSILSLTVLAGTGTHGASVEKFDVDTNAVPGTHPVSVVVPDGTDGKDRPLLVFLHGRGGNSDTYTDQEPFFKALEDQGNRAPVVAFPDGGESSYWHDRDGGNWDAYLMKDVIPQVADRFGTDVSRIAVGGISMGGFGALDLAMHHRGAFCAAGGHSPALYTSGGESAPGAFDDAEDFADNDVIQAATTDPGAFSNLPVWLDAGKSDPFVPGVTAMRSALEASGADLTDRENWRGGHTEDYWNDHWSEYLAFYAKALAQC